MALQKRQTMSLYGMSTGRLLKFLQALDDAGFDQADVDSVIGDPEIALNLKRASWGYDVVEPSSTTPNGPGLFATPAQQIANVRRWNEKYDWGFTEDDFPHPEDTPLDIPHFLKDNDLEVHVLAVYLPDSHDTPGYVRTFKELWHIASFQQRRVRESDITLDTEHLRLLEGYTHKPGLRWVALDLRAYQGLPPGGVRGPGLAHSEILSVAAHSPRWVQLINGRHVPHVSLAAYRASTDGEDWSSVPYIGWNLYENQILLGIVGQNESWAEFANPTVKKP